MSGTKRPARVQYDTGFLTEVRRAQEAADLLRSQEATRRRAEIEQQQRIVAERRVADLERRVAADRAAAQQERLEMQRSIENTARQMGVVSDQMRSALRDVDTRMTAKLGEITTALNANTALLQENRRAMARGFDEVLKSVIEESRKAELKSMKEAADLIDEVLERRSELSPHDIAEAAPEQFAELERTLSAARTRFREGNSGVARDIAAVALKVAVETSAKVTVYQAERRKQLSEASSLLAAVQTQVEWLGSTAQIVGEEHAVRSVAELVELWMPGAREALNNELTAALVRPLHELTVAELQALTPRLAALQTRASEIETQVRQRIAQHEMRSRLVDALCEAMGKELFALDDVQFEKEGDPSSDLLIKTSNGPMVRIPIDCDRRHFQIEHSDPASNARHAEKIFAGLRKHGIEAAGFDVVQERGSA